MLKISGPCKFRKKEDYKSVLAEQNCVSFLKLQSGQSASVFEMKTLTLFTMGFFGAAHGRGGGGQKGHPYLKSVIDILQWWNLAQLYLSLKRSKKHINHVRQPLRSTDISNFSLEISKFCYIKKYMYRLSFNFSWVFKVYFNKKVTISMMSAKMATPGLLKIKVMTLWFMSMTSPAKLSCDPNYIVDVVMWPKFGNRSISMREVIIILTL